MTWTKLGDEYGDECWTLSDAAYRLHNEGLIWSNRKATDGKLAKDDMVRWAKRPAAAQELVASGWWLDRGDHYRIVHHLGYQRTAEQIAHQSNVNRKNIRKRWGETKPEDGSSDTSRNTSRNTKGTGRTGLDKKK